MQIIPYADAYKEQLLSMVLEARIALGLSPEVRADLYDVKANFWTGAICSIWRWKMAW